MSYVAIDDSGRIVMLRKETTCEWCGECLLVGDKAVTRTYTVDSDLRDARMHPECYQAMLAYYHRPDVAADEPFDPGWMAKGLPLHIDEVKATKEKP